MLVLCRFSVSLVVFFVCRTFGKSFRADGKLHVSKATDFVVLVKVALFA